MPEAERTDDEQQRLKALRDYQVLDTPREPEFDNIVELATQTCDAPIAVVNLVAEHRQWFKAETGLGTRQTPRACSLCAHALLEEEHLVVPDLTDDPRFEDNPLVVDDPHLRFYAGVLLKTPDGYPLGTICVLDTRRRTMDEGDLQVLEILADQTMHLLEMRRITTKQAQLLSEFAESLDEHRELQETVSVNMRTSLTVANLAAYHLQNIRSEDETTREIAEELVESTREMSELAQRLVRESTAHATDPASWNAGNLVQEVIRANDDTARARNIRMVSSLPELAPWVRCDRERTIQVLNNVLRNMLGIASPGQIIDVKLDRDDGQVIFDITGPESRLTDQTFKDVFAWESAPGKASIEGPEIGLAVARRFVELQDGQMRVESDTDDNIRVWFSLPLADHAPSAPGTADE